MDVYKPSIAELQQVEREMLPGPWDAGEDASDGEVTDHDRGKLIAQIRRAPVEANTAGIAVLRNVAPVLLEIAAAAKVHADTECSCGAELGCFPDCAREVAGQALLAALAKVRP